MLKLGEKVEDVVKEREVTVDRTSQRGTGPRNSLNFLGREPRSLFWVLVFVVGDYSYTLAGGT